MFKKIFIVLTLVLLCACQKQEVIVEPVIKPIEKEEYIKPVKDILIYAELAEPLKSQIKIANCNSSYKNYQFAMLGKQGYDGVLKDLSDNEFSLDSYDEYMIEIVSNECSHCKKQLALLDDLVSKTDIPFIQCFNHGTKDEIYAMYDEQNATINENIRIVECDDAFRSYLKDELKIEAYPSLITYKDNKLSFISVGEVNEVSFEKIINFGFNDLIEKEDIVDKQGNNLLEISRSVDDLKNDLSEDSLKKIEELDNDDYTQELTFKLMGSKLDYSKQSNDPNEAYFNEIDDYSSYENERVVLFYTYLRDNSETDKVDYINSLMVDPDVKYIVVLIEGIESSSAALRNMNVRFRCPVVSVLGKIPDDFFKFGLVNYPSATFVDRGVFTGAYSNIESKEKMAEAIDMFLSDNCIAYLKNN